MGEVSPEDVGDADWDEACRRAEVIRSFIANHAGATTAKHVAKLAGKLGASQATAYRLLKLFREGGTVLALVNRRRGRPKGHRVLDGKRDKIIQAAIKSYYLKRTRPPVSQLIVQVQADCVSAKLKPPHRRTILARINDVDVRKRAQLRGEGKTVNATLAVPGGLAVARPLELVQIDHTRADIFVVDEQTREPIGRPWLTLAMDVCSRMVSGFYLTMSAPSRLSTSLCLLHSVFDKSAWLNERGIAEPWPVAGLPDMIYVDNGPDFRSKAFTRGCQDAGILLDWRPPSQPRFGGHIERLIGTQMGKLHLLPGTTFSNSQDRGDYDPKRHAALTLRELERYIALEIAGTYHQTIHKGLVRPPLAVWREHEAKIPLRLPQDRMRFWLAFLPEEERTLRPDGIHLFGLRYWSNALNADVGRSGRRLLVKYDPRDMARVFIKRPSGTFVEARYADVTLPTITLHEAIAARRTLLAQGRREADMTAIVRTTLAQRALVSEAQAKTRAARQGRGGSNKKTWDRGEEGILRGVDSSKPVPGLDDGLED